MSIWYITLSLVTVLITFWLWTQQTTGRERRWLVQQLKKADNSPESLQRHHEALKQCQQKANSGQGTVLILLLLAIPAAWLIQSWAFDNQAQPAVSDQQAPDLASAIAQLEQKLAENPDDLQGQLLYAQSMAATKQYDRAAAAYAKANELKPDDAMILTEWAEAIAFRNNTGSFLGEPAPLLKQALSINPQHQKAMWLYGIVLFEQGQHADAESLWTDLLSQVDSPGVQDTLRQQINQARNAQGKPPLAEATLVSYAVDLQIEGEAPESSVLFVVAKSSDGMPMPIAVKRITGPFEWPISVTLSDTDNLQANRPLNQFKTVQIAAHISLTGNADDKSWLSETVTAEPQQNIALTLIKAKTED